MSNTNLSNQLSIIASDERYSEYPQASDALLELVGVPAEFGAYIRVFDQHESLVLLHYLRTDNLTAMTKIRHVRGTIVDTSTNTIVCQSFGYTPEITVDSNSQIPDQSELLTYYRALEGSVVRVYWWGNEWRVSTHHKIDANASRWNGKSFRYMFDQTRKFELDSLVKTACYMFLVSHPACRVIYPVSEPQVTLATVWLPEGAWVRPGNTTYYNFDVNTPQLASQDDIQNLVSGDISCDSGMTGIISVFWDPNGAPVTCKFVPQKYSNLKELRGSDTTLRRRYLELRNTGELTEFLELFNEPEHESLFAEIEQDMDNLVKSLHFLYIRRYIKKDLSNVYKEAFVTIRRCHEWHMQNRTDNIVTAGQVRKMLLDTPVHFLDIMLRREKNRLKQRAETQKKREAFLQGGQNGMSVVSELVKEDTQL